MDALRIARVPVTSWDMLSVPAASYIAAACLLSVSLVEGVGGALPSAPPAAARVPAARATPWPAALLGPAMLIADARRRDSLCVFTLALATVRRIMRHEPRGDSIVRLLFDGRHAPRLTLAESRVRRAVLDLPPPSPLPPRPSSLGIIRNAMQIGDM